MFKAIRVKHFNVFKYENGVEICNPATETTCIGFFGSYQEAKVFIDKQPKNCLYETLATYTYEILEI